MADSNLVALNQLYGATSVSTNDMKDLKKQDSIKIIRDKFNFIEQKDIPKYNVALNDDVQPEDPIPSQVRKTQSDFVGYLDQDYDINSLQKRIGNYWITILSKKIVLYTGYQFVQLGGGGGEGGDVSAKKYNFTNSGTQQNPVPEYPLGVSYDIVKSQVVNKTIVYIVFLNNVYRLGNATSHSMQFSFQDEDNYKQIRLFDSTESYRTQYFVQTKSNYTQL